MTLDHPVALAPADRAVQLLGGDLTEKALRLHLDGLSGVDAVGLEQRAAGLSTRSIKTSSKAWALETRHDAARMRPDRRIGTGARHAGHDPARSVAKASSRPDATTLRRRRVRQSVCVYSATTVAPYAS